MKRYTKRVFRALGGVEPVKGISEIECLQKLASYEDADELGRLIELPVGIGDHLWGISDGVNIKEYIVDGALFDKDTGLDLWLEDLDGRGNITFPDWAIGEVIFRTKKEAEAKLTELEGKNGSKI